MDVFGLKLSEPEQELFTQLYNYYDSDNTGFISVSKIIQLFNSSQLPSHVLDQIIELVGTSRTSSLTRNQFYLMLRFVGVAQSGLPLSSDSISSLQSIPLPQFQQMNDSNKQQLMVNIEENNKIGDKSENSSHKMTGHLPPPPTKASVRSNRQWNNQFVNSDNFTNRQFITTSPNHINTVNNNNNINDNYNHLINCEHTEKTVPRSSSESDLNDSPTDSIDKLYYKRDKSWSEFNEKEKNSDEPINWADFEEEHHLLENQDEDEDELKSDHSSDDESFNIWIISDEQKNYYINQFKTMQTNLNGKITGKTAKDFFEKSCLPIQELSKIWQLSDEDKDGALTLDEFCVAMHLVVLRRNCVELPDKLPLTLMPSLSPVQSRTLNSSKSNDLANTTDGPYNSVSPQYNDLNEIKGIQEETISPQNKQWMKFTDSPTSNIVATVSSPPSTSSSASGMQLLANFDFSTASIVRDPKILHPVAVRLSPDGQPILYDSNEILNENDVRKRFVSSADSLKLPTYIAVNTATTGKKDPPPPPPPRPHRAHGHARSSSLDLNRVVVRSSMANDLINSQLSTHLKVSNSEYGLTGTLKEINSKNLGAFVAYKKAPKQETSLTNSSVADSLKHRFKIPPEVPIPNRNLSDNSELIQTIKSFQDYTKMLVNINNEMIEELIKVTETKNILELQLLQLNNGCKH